MTIQTNCSERTEDPEGSIFLTQNSEVPFEPLTLEQYGRIQPQLYLNRGIYDGITPTETEMIRLDMVLRLELTKLMGARSVSELFEI
jgi:hypothetical protein